jgi:predicted AlkP superfamily pyrophosphatase or phosphodiesterase
MDDKDLEEKVRALTFWSGKNSMTLDEMAAVQPGLARLMPEVGARTWKLYYAAKAENWPMAKFQYKEIIGLMELGAFMRPKHQEALEQFMAENWKPLEQAIEKKDFALFEAAFHSAIDMANAYHELKEKPYIRWKLPDTPPPDLDMTPRGGGKK